MKRRVFGILAAALLLCVSFRAQAMPAKPGPVKICQPDGTVVTVFIKGDEAGHVVTSADGCSLVRGSDGFLCYAEYAPDGSRRSSGVHFGHDATGGAAAASRLIPYSAISRKAASRRMLMTPSRGQRHSFVETRTGGKTVHRAVVLLAQFPDLKFRFGRNDFIALVNNKGYNYNGASGSALDYFNAQFKGEADFEFEIGPVVTLSKGYAYYGKDDDDGNDLYPHLAVAEACRLSDKDVDFSKYDYVYVFYAGGSPADGLSSDDHIWPHSWDLESAGVNLVLDGKRISQYSMSSELMNDFESGAVFTSIGTFCHEYSHILGLPDFYDTDYEKSSGKSDALWESTSLMDAGGYNNFGRTPPNYNALELWLLDLLEPEDIHSGDYILAPLHTVRRALCMESGIEGEFLLFESRQASGWDTYIGGSGLLVYHVDMSDRDAGYSTDSEKNLTAWERWGYNEVNCNPSHQCVDLIEADPSATDVSKVFFPYNNRNSLSVRTHPTYKLWDGTAPAMSLSNIRKNAGTSYFTVDGPLVIDVKDAHQDAVILNWHTDQEAFSKKPVRLSWTGGKKSGSVTISPYDSGKYSYTIEGLSPDTDYTVTVAFEDASLAALSSSVTVTTKSLGGLPFIYLSSASRNSAGKFTQGTKIPLRVYNIPDTSSVTWYWDEQEITVSETGYLVIAKSGRLKAVVTRRDGSEVMLVKQIYMR